MVSFLFGAVVGFVVALFVPESWKIAVKEKITNLFKKKETED